MQTPGIPWVLHAALPAVLQTITKFGKSVYYSGAFPESFSFARIEPVYSCMRGWYTCSRRCDLVAVAAAVAAGGYCHSFWFCGLSASCLLCRSCRSSRHRQRESPVPVPGNGQPVIRIVLLAFSTDLGGCQSTQKNYYVYYLWNLVLNSSPLPLALFLVVRVQTGKKTSSHIGGLIRKGRHCGVSLPLKGLAEDIRVLSLAFLKSGSSFDSDSRVITPPPHATTTYERESAVLQGTL